MAMYVLLGYGPPAPAAAPTTGDTVGRLTADLVTSGEFVYAVGLADAAFAHVVTVQEGHATVAEGRQVDASTALSGFSVVDVVSHDRALQVAARTAALLGPVEVRPLVAGSSRPDRAGGDARQ